MKRPTPRLKKSLKKNKTAQQPALTSTTAPQPTEPPTESPIPTPEPPQTASPSPQPPLSKQRPWLAQYEAVVGLTHRNAQPPLPCQDAALAAIQPRPCVIVADGAGSSAVSEIGAQTVVTGLARLLHTLEKQLATLLDTQPTPEHEDEHKTQTRNFALLLTKHALGLLQDLAAQHRRELRDFRCTLLLAVIGQQQTLWLRVGDGALIAQHLEENAQTAQTAQTTPTPQEKAQPGTRWQVLGLAGKGEFANQTTFVDANLQPSQVQSGTLPTAYLCGLAAMSDGAAEKLVAHDGQRVAPQLGHWLHALRQDQLPRRTLTRSFYSDSFCQGSTGDDCSLALLACGLV